MSERYEYVQSTSADSVVSASMEKRLQGRLDSGHETAQEAACQGCEHLALCGIAINILQRNGTSLARASPSLEAYGIQTDGEAAMCPGKMVNEAVRRNDNNEFWVLKADELARSSDQVKTAQAVERAAEDVVRIINKKLII